jgi:hypothetical protein
MVELRKPSPEGFFPKNNPGCFHQLSEYLSKLTGLSIRVPLIIKDREGLLRNPKAKRKQLGYRSYDITVISIDGKRVSYMQEGNIRYDEAFPNLVVDHYEVMIYRPHNSFGIELTYVGNYRDSLGGGWHTTVSLFEHNGNYFAPAMECTH